MAGLLRLYDFFEATHLADDTHAFWAWLNSAESEDMWLIIKFNRAAVYKNGAYRWDLASIPYYVRHFQEFRAISRQAGLWTFETFTVSDNVLCRNPQQRAPFYGLCWQTGLSFAEVMDTKEWGL
jgi:hypothetical protein